MGEDMITPHEKIILELISEDGEGMTKEMIQAYNTERELGLPVDELDTLLKSLEARHFLRLKRGMRTKWYITMRGLLDIKNVSGGGWP
jgi:predicted nuclease of restriction endonuclease-like RecB superfamily